MNWNLLRLALCQGLFMTNNVTFIAINGLVGLQLAPVPWLATLPVTAYVAGSAASAALVARHQRRAGRSRAFQAGLWVAVAATLLCALAAWQRSFGLLVAATAFGGYYSANAALYRFAAAEVVTPDWRERAISWVLAGGILGGVAGPFLASRTHDLLARPFTAAYLALTAVALLSLAILRGVRFPPPPAASALAAGRRLREIAAQPAFVVAIAAAALGYGVMNLLMAATPLAMAQCGHPFGSAATVLQWHVLGMFVPSFFTGHLIRAFGCLRVMTAGLLLNVACVAVALSGTELMHFTAALVALGVGWNFLYVGGTTLLIGTYRPEEKTSAQGAMDTCVFLTMTLTSFSSGALVTTGGWTSMNVGTLLPLGALAAALAWLGWRQRPVVRPG